MRLIWNHGEGLVDGGAGHWRISEKPVLPFDFDGVFFDDIHGHFQHLKGAGQVPLTIDEQAAIRTWISQQARPPAAPIPFAHTEAQLSQVAQERLDAGARARGYDSILSLVSYRSSNVKKFSREACEGHVWRDKVWAYCHDQFARMEAGDRTTPTPEEFLTELPDPIWPERMPK